MKTPFLLTILAAAVFSGLSGTAFGQRDYFYHGPDYGYGPGYYAPVYARGHAPPYSRAYLPAYSRPYALAYGASRAPAGQKGGVSVEYVRPSSTVVDGGVATGGIVSGLHHHRATSNIPPVSVARANK